MQVLDLGSTLNVVKASNKLKIIVNPRFGVDPKWGKGFVVEFGIEKQSKPHPPDNHFMLVFIGPAAAWVSFFVYFYVVSKSVGA